MTNPAIQNDFSYYRRTLSRMRINNVPVSVLHKFFYFALCFESFTYRRLDGSVGRSVLFRLLRLSVNYADAKATLLKPAPLMFSEKKTVCFPVFSVHFPAN